MPHLLLWHALNNWQIDMPIIDQAVSRILRIILKSGKMDKMSAPKGAVNTPEHQSLARKLAEEAITLLKNDGNLLPLDRTRLKSVAILGPNAAEAVIEGGGSSHVDPPYRVTPLEALKTKMGGKVDLQYEQGCDNFDETPVVPADWFTLPEGTDHGMRAEYFDNPDLSGQPEHRLIEPRPSFWRYMSSTQQPDPQFSARWTARLIVPVDGRYLFKLGYAGICRVLLNEELIFDGSLPVDDRLIRPEVIKETQKELHGGQPYSLRIEFFKYPGQEILSYRLMAALCLPQTDERLRRAVEVAKKCELAVVFAGMPEGYESEGTDRPDMDLPGGQDALIHAVAQANPKTVVVLNAGSPVSMPWLDEVAAVVMAYYPGQENGNAVANVLLGKVNPSGKLPVTFPKRLQDNPAFMDSPFQGARQIIYGEGLFVGYRYYDQEEIEPMFPFGHGLSYTSFMYGRVKVPETAVAGEGIRITATVKNTGKITGKEIVQLYLVDRVSSLPRPPKELKGFAKVTLQPGEEKIVTFELNERAMAFYDPHQKGWVTEPGEFEVLLGSSSRDIRARATFTLM